MDIKLTSELLIQYLGNPNKHEGNYYKWQCPGCEAEGRDRHKDNLIFDSQKGYLRCFANPIHSNRIISKIYKDFWAEYKSNNKKVKGKYIKTNTYEDADKYDYFFNEDVQQELREYILNCSDFLLTSEQHKKQIFEKRFITKDTIENLLIGYDIQNNCWLFPTIAYSTTQDPNEIKFLGFERRPYNFDKSGIRRGKDMPTGLAMINTYEPTTKILIIVEGYLDGYTLYQHLKEKNQIQYYQIVTCSNGVTALEKQIKEVNFLAYEKFYLFIDNDDVSRPIAAKIIEKYPFIQDYVLPCGCKDFNDHYIKCITNTKYINTLPIIQYMKTMLLIIINYLIIISLMIIRKMLII